MSDFTTDLLATEWRWALALCVFVFVATLKRIPWISKHVLTTAVRKQLAALGAGLPILIAAWVDGATWRQIGNLALYTLIGSIGVHDLLGGLGRQFPAFADILLRRRTGRAKQETVPDKGSSDVDG